MSTRRQQREQAQHFIEQLSGESFTGSRRVYLHGSDQTVRVPMRSIAQSDSLLGGDAANPVYQANEPVLVYDTSGPYGDPDININVHNGLQGVREQWIEQRGDCEAHHRCLSGASEISTLAAEVLHSQGFARIRTVAVSRLSR